MGVTKRGDSLKATCSREIRKATSKQRSSSTLSCFSWDSWTPNFPPPIPYESHPQKTLVCCETRLALGVLGGKSPTSTNILPYQQVVGWSNHDNGVGQNQKSAHLGKPLRVLQKNVWLQFHEFGKFHHLCVAAVSGGSTVLPSRKLTYPTMGKEHHLQKCLGRGYVSSLERKLEKILAGSTCWLALRWCSRRLNTRFSTQVVLMRSHVSPSLLCYPSFFQKVKMEDIFHQEILSMHQMMHFETNIFTSSANCVNVAHLPGCPCQQHPLP